MQGAETFYWYHYHLNEQFLPVHKLIKLYWCVINVNAHQLIRLWNWHILSFCIIRALTHLMDLIFSIWHVRWRDNWSNACISFMIKVWVQFRHLQSHTIMHSRMTNWSDEAIINMFLNARNNVLTLKIFLKKDLF